LILGLTIAMTYLWRRQEQIGFNAAPVRSMKFNSIGQFAAPPRG